MTSAVAVLKTVTFKEGEYRTNGCDLVRIAVILPDGDVMVEDAMTGESVVLPALELDDWVTPRQWSAKKAKPKAPRKPRRKAA